MSSIYSHAVMGQQAASDEESSWGSPLKMWNIFLCVYYILACNSFCHPDVSTAERKISVNGTRNWGPIRVTSYHANRRRTHTIKSQQCVTLHNSSHFGFSTLLVQTESYTTDAGWLKEARPIASRVVGWGLQRDTPEGPSSDAKPFPSSRRGRVTAERSSHVCSFGTAAHKCI